MTPLLAALNELPKAGTAHFKQDVLLVEFHPVYIIVTLHRDPLPKSLRCSVTMKQYRLVANMQSVTVCNFEGDVQI